MAALATVQGIKHNQGEVGFPQVLANAIIYQGAMVGITAAGYAQPYATGNFFAGHALETVDATGLASGAARVPVLRGSGGTYYMTVPVFNSTTVAHIGDAVWGATDNHADLSRTDPGTTLTTTDRKATIHDIDPAGNVILKFATTC